MFKCEKVLGLITARGDSKRLPRKTLLRFIDKPLIAWTIEAGVGSKIIDSVIVSTDDSEIYQTCIDLGVDEVIARPKELATDKASSLDVLFHAIEQLSVGGQDYGYVALLQPTSPLRNFQHIDDAFDLMLKKNASAIIGVCETEHPMEWMTALPEDYSLKSFLSRIRSDYPVKEINKGYQINGAIYLYDVKKLLMAKPTFPETDAYAFIMDRHVSVDIDTHLDFITAEFYFNYFGHV